MNESVRNWHKRDYLGVHGISGAEDRPALPSTSRRPPPVTQSRHFENSRFFISSAAVAHELSTADNVVRYPVWAHDRRRRWSGRAVLAPRGRSFASRTFRRLRA